MGYGTVLASFNVEEFGTERVARLTRERDRRALRGAARDDPVRSRCRPRRRTPEIRDLRPEAGSCENFASRKRGLGEAMATEQQTKDASVDGGRRRAPATR